MLDADVLILHLVPGAEGNLSYIPVRCRAPGGGRGVGSTICRAILTSVMIEGGDGRGFMSGKYFFRSMPFASVDQAAR